MKKQYATSEGFYTTGDGHRIYYESTGNTNGPSILFIHGGPGLGTSENDRLFFDLSKVNLIRFDQRGCGKSTPHGSLENNTTQHLIADILCLLNHLKIDKVVLFGGSWGSTLSLLFGILHPERVAGMVLRGIFLATNQERYFFEYGVTKLFRPNVWKAYAAHIPENQLAFGSAYYYDQILHGNPEVQDKLAHAFTAYGLSLSKKEEMPVEEVLSVIDQSDYLIRARILAHYSVHDFFLNEGYILDNINRLDDTPISIVQGKFDLITPPEMAIEIADKLPRARLKLQDGGHSPMEDEMFRVLKEEVKYLIEQLKN